MSARKDHILHLRLSQRDLDALKLAGEVSGHPTHAFARNAIVEASARAIGAPADPTFGELCDYVIGPFRAAVAVHKASGDPVLTARVLGHAVRGWHPSVIPLTIRLAEIATSKGTLVVDLETLCATIRRDLTTDIEKHIGGAVGAQESEVGV